MSYTFSTWKYESTWNGLVLGGMTWESKKETELDLFSRQVPVMVFAVAYLASPPKNPYIKLFA